MTVDRPIELRRDLVEPLSNSRGSPCHGIGQRCEFVFDVVLGMHHDVGFVLNLTQMSDRQLDDAQHWGFLLFFEFFIPADRRYRQRSPGSRSAPFPKSREKHYHDLSRTV